MTESYPGPIHPSPGTPREPGTEGPNRSPFFSVVVATYNRAHLLSSAIESVLGQTCPDFELVVIDDGSTDATEEVVARIADGRIVYLRCDHRGVGATRNEGISTARGRYVVFLDSDDVAVPEWLDSLRSAATDSDLIFCGMQARDRQGEIRWRWTPAPDGVPLDDLLVHFESGQVAYRRSLLVSSGGFEPSLAFGENTELGIRLLLRSGRRLSLTFVPQVLVHVRTAGIESDYTWPRPASAEYVIDKYPELRKQAPKLWASYHSILGTHLVRIGSTSQARRHFLRAAVSGRKPEHLKRLLASLIPSLATVVWPLAPQLDEPPTRDSLEVRRVLFVALAEGLGGSMRSLSSLLQHLEGFYRVVASPSPTGFTDLIDQDRSFERRLVLPTGPRGRLHKRTAAAVTLAVYAWLYRSQLAVIHANGLSERNVVALASAVSRRPVVVWVHEWQISKWSLRLAPILRVLNPKTVFVAVSPQTQEMLVAAGLATPESVAVVPNPIDPAQVRGVTEPPRPGRSACTVGYLGAPAEYKGFHLLPDVIRATETAPVEWVIYSGPRTAMSAVWSELQSFDSSRVHLRDKVVDVTDAYSECDIVYCPSLEESFGRVAAEAMTNGISVVASDLPSLRALLGDNEAGILVAPGDITAAATAIRSLAGDSDLRARLGDAGRVRAADYEPDRIARSMAEIYLELSSISPEPSRPPGATSPV